MRTATRTNRRTRRANQNTASFFAQKPALAPATETAADTFFSPKNPLPGASVQRKCTDCENKEKEKVQRKPGGGQPTAKTNAAPPIVGQTLQSGGGKPMDSATRHFMESRFGQDFSEVKIHVGASAAESARAINAKAYTSGEQIVFGNGQFSPETEGGQRLLAHELAHVVQQRGGENRIQRAEIDYRQLTWSDFKGGKVPGGFDAVTSTRIKAPDFQKAKPTLTEKDTKTPCELLDAKGKVKTDGKGAPKMSTSREVEIKMNTDVLELKSKMNQNKSAAKPFFKNPATRKAECVKEQVVKCESFFKEEAKNKRTGGSFGSATEQKECKSKLLPECEAEKQKSADNLLIHEQGHFDLTEAFARSGTTELKKLADEVGTTTVSGCGAGAGKKEAEKTLKGGLSDTIKAKIDEIRERFTAIALNTKDKKTGEVTTGELWKTQDEYDTDSSHNQNATGQATWNHKISEMLNP